MKKIVFTIALLALLTAVAFASGSATGELNSKHESSDKIHKHTHIVVPSDHYSM